MPSIEQQQKWIDQGRGEGELSSYKPWITVRDIASKGRSHRLYGHKTKRTHHLLSDLELAFFLVLEWTPFVYDIREQFPLSMDQTDEIAQQLSIAHPAVQGVKQTMSTDFYVLGSDSKQFRLAIQAKYKKDLEDRRTIEKLAIEKRFWDSKNVEYRIITEDDIPKEVFDNIKWLYPAMRESENFDGYSTIDFYVQQFRKYPNLSLINLCKQLDTSYHLDSGTSLSELRVLFAQRYFKFDIRLDYKKLKLSDIQLGESNLWEEIRHAANQ